MTEQAEAEKVSKLVVREAGPADIHKVWAMRMAMATVEMQTNPPRFWSGTYALEMYRATLDCVISPSTVVLLAETEEGGPVGLLTFREGHVAGYGHRTDVTVQHFYAQPGSGAGPPLVRRMKSVMRKHDLSGLQTVVLYHNRDMAAQLERTGWEPVAVVYERRWPNE